MNIENTETHQRLLETAALVFAEHGYSATTVRMICSRAKVNVSAINYHFGGKENLYREVLRYVRRRVYEKYPPTYGLHEAASAEERLGAFVRSFLLRALGNDGNLGFGTLMMREIVEPTGALDMIIDESIRSLFELLLDIVANLLGKGADTGLVEACSRSIIGQCVFYLCGRSVITRMAPEQKFTPEDIEIIAGQIVTFSMHALQGTKESVCRHNQLLKM